MSFGSKPNAWARQAPPGQQINPNLFTGQLNLAQQFANPAMQLGLGNPATGLGALVNPAAFNNMNPQILQAQRQAMSQNMQQRPTSPQGNKPNQRTFVGTVTKLMDTYGFIDEDVFFQTSAIRGSMPRVGEKVMVEASFNPSMPFKWNAVRIQMIQDNAPPPQQNHPPPRQGGGMAPHPTGNRWSDAGGRAREERSSIDRHRPSRRSPLPRREDRRSPPQRRSPRRSPPPRKLSPVRRPEPVKRERERTPPPHRESREIRRASPASVKRDVDSPPRRRQRIIPRYQCYLPRPIVADGSSYSELHKRYPNLYIPSDFIKCDFSWKKSFNLSESISFAPSSVEFHVVHKDVDFPLNEGESLPNEQPEDADSRYVVRVLLLTHPGAAAIRQKVTGLLADGSIDESCDAQTLFKVLQMVVGCRGKGEVMGIGGAWSPSLDGENPLDPLTLIKTAVRTTKAQTGVDLSNCTVWYKMVHLRYYRPERDRSDSVVLMLPDTSATPNLQPTAETYNRLVEEVFPLQLKQKIAAIDDEIFTPASDAAKKVAASKEKESSVEITNGETKTETTVSDQKASEEQTATESAANGDTEANGTDKNDESTTRVPTHWSKLQIKAMKVVELRDELEARGLDPTGLKNVLSQRLTEALESEKSAEEASSKKIIEEDDDIMIDETGDPSVINPGDLVITDEVDEKMEVEEKKAEPSQPEISKQEYDEYKKELEKFEKSKKERKSALERHFTFPKEPCVLIYPSKIAKSGKFDCRLTTMQSLLDYRQDDNKESSFEVFLFAEALHEAIDRNYAFGLYHTLHTVLDKDEEKKRRDEALTKPAEEEGKPEEAAEADNEEAAKSEEKKDEKKDEKPADPRVEFKAVVNDVNLFTILSHFDQNICGYLNDRDIEEIIHSVGLPISRGAIQRLVKKVSSRDRFNYRNVSDKWVDKDGNVKYSPEPLPDAPTRIQLIETLETLEKEMSEKEPSAASGATSAEGSTPDVTSTGVVFYKGKVLNIAHVQEQHKIVDTERSDALLKIQQLEQQFKTTKEQRDHSDKKRKRLEDDLDRYKKKLYEAEKCLKNSQDDTVQMKTSLMDVKKFGERLIGIVDKLMPPPKKDKDEKKDSHEKSTEKETTPKDENSQKEEKQPKEEATPEVAAETTETPVESAEATVPQTEAAEEKI